MHKNDQIRTDRSRIRLFVLVVYFSLWACGTQRDAADDIIATVGDRTITVASFQRVYFPQILYLDKQDSPETREEVLDALITQKILAQEAEKIHLDTTALVRRATKIAERKSMAKLLYREWVQQRINPPTEQEVWEAFVRSCTRLLVRHLAVATKAEADSLFQILLSGSATFEEIARDIFEDVQLRYSGGLLGWVTFGDLDESLEDAAFKLEAGIPSEPVQSPYGWHILRVDDSRRLVAFDKREFDRQRKNLETRVYMRHELRFGTQILNDYMKSKNIEFNKEVAEQVWAILRPRLQGIRESGALFSSEFLKLAQGEFGLENESLLANVLVSFEGGSWTVEMFLDRLPEMKREYLFRNLAIGTAYLIRDELLAREGYARKYNRDADVIRRVEDKKDQLLEHLYLGAILDTMTFTSSSLKRYYEKNWEKRYYGPDSLLLQEILVVDKSEADNIMHQLRQGRPFTDLALHHNTNTDALTPEGYLGWQVAGKTKYPLLYSKGLRAKLNVPLGPIETPRGWSIFRAIARHRYPIAYEEIKDRVRKDLEQELYQVLRSQTVTNSLSNYRIDINRELLHSF